jgi:hypothetical protein
MFGKHSGSGFGRSDPTRDGVGANRGERPALTTGLARRVQPWPKKARISTRLTALMFEHEGGVSGRESYTIKAVDSHYLEETQGPIGLLASLVAAQGGM